MRPMEEDRKRIVFQLEMDCRALGPRREHVRCLVQEAVLLNYKKLRQVLHHNDRPIDLPHDYPKQIVPLENV